MTCVTQISGKAERPLKFQNIATMKIDQIKEKEAANDGQTIHLFYDDIAGMYMAFGLSAYYTTMSVEPVISYSDALGMPVALLNRGVIQYLRQSVTKVEHQQKSYYRFQLRTKVGDAGYRRWCKETFGDQDL